MMDRTATAFQVYDYRAIMPRYRLGDESNSREPAGDTAQRPVLMIPNHAPRYQFA